MRATLNRIASGLAAAAATGAVYAAVIVMFAASGDRMHPAEIVANGAQAAVAGAVFGIVIGGLPAVAIVYLTRARYVPWRGASILVLGAVCGMLVSDAAMLVLSNVLAADLAEMGIAILSACAAAGAFVASRFIPRAPEGQ